MDTGNTILLLFVGVEIGEVQWLVREGCLDFLSS
ncbi:hypothetical protein BH20ACI2_BH20ACI2_26080 [soil metagenome]